MIDARIRFRHLNCFLEVSRLGSVIKAADKLAVSQPAVSKTLRELEEILDAQLFNRSKRGLTLTPLGQLFQSYAGASVAALREGVASLVEARSGGAAAIGVGVLPTVAARLMPATVSAFRASGGRARCGWSPVPMINCWPSCGWGSWTWWWGVWGKRS